MTDFKPVHFSGEVKYQFTAFGQVAMITEKSGDQVFVGRAHGFFGSPPQGTPFEAEIRLTVGAKFDEAAYQVRVHPALAQLGASTAFSDSVRDYTHQAMSTLFGPQWTQQVGLTATDNLLEMPGELHTIRFDDLAQSW